MNIVALIPARSGSKSVRDKNIRIMNGLPMMAYSILQANESKYINRVIVSTDSEKYAKIAREYGAETPFLRPSYLSNDKSLDIDVFEHAANWLQENENYKVDIFVHLRPTHPIRNVEDIDKMIEMLIKDDSADSIRSVSIAKSTPYKMWCLNTESKCLSPILSCPDIAEAYNAPRQDLPVIYEQNACIDVIKAQTIICKHSMTGNKILGYVMNFNFDIDEEDDFLNAERYLMLKEAESKNKRLKIVCDIDGVIAAKTEGNDYSTATPMLNNIKIINSLHDKGHEIVLFTARGSATGIDWATTTASQMKQWGVKYDSLKFGKPDADVYIDDKAYELTLLI